MFVVFFWIVGGWYPKVLRHGFGQLSTIWSMILYKKYKPSNLGCSDTPKSHQVDDVNYMSHDICTKKTCVCWLWEQWSFKSTLYITISGWYPLFYPTSISLYSHWYPIVYPIKIPFNAVSCYRKSSFFIANHLQIGQSKLWYHHLEVSINGGSPKWLLQNGKNNTWNGWFDGTPIISGHLHFIITTAPISQRRIRHRLFRPPSVDDCPAPPRNRSKDRRPPSRTLVVKVVWQGIHQNIHICCIYVVYILYLYMDRVYLRGP